MNYSPTHNERRLRDCLRVAADRANYALTDPDADERIDLLDALEEVCILLSEASGAHARNLPHLLTEAARVLTEAAAVYPTEN